MGTSTSTVPTNNLIVLLHQDDNKKTIAYLDSKMNDTNTFSINKPINKMGDTILHYAAFKKNKDLILYLQKHGAAANVKNSRDLLPKDVVTDIEIIQLLESGSKH